MSWLTPGQRRATGVMTVMSLTALALAIGVPLPALAQDPGTDEVADEPVPTPPEKFSTQKLDRLVSAAGVDVPTDPITSTKPIERYFYDGTASTGTAEQICVELHNRTLDDVHDRLPLPGALAAYAYLDSLFTWPTPGTMGHCREVHSGSGCRGRMYPDDVGLEFYSTCWSNHAAGRAVDFCVTGCSVTQEGTRQGNALVNWLLAADSSHRNQARARRLGVEQILWNNRCWSAASWRATTDRKVRSVSAMRVCGIGHENHVHVDFTIDGAKGLTSGYRSGRPPVIAPAGDFDGAGFVDVLARRGTDLYLFRGDGGGNLVLPSVRVGRAWSVFNLIAPAGDFDGNGTVDVLARRRASGDLYLYRGDGDGGFAYPAVLLGRRWNVFNVIAPAGDFDGSGTVDVLVRRGDNGDLYLYRGDGDGGFVYPRRPIGNWWCVFDVIAPAGDFDGDGAVDVLVREFDTGDLFLYRGDGDGGFVHPRVRIGRRWSVFDVIAPAGDLDEDGAVDVLARRADTGVLYLYRGDGHGGFDHPGEAIESWRP